MFAKPSVVPTSSASASRQRLRERADDRDRAAAAGEQHVAAPRRRPRGARRVVGRARRSRRRSRCRSGRAARRARCRTAAARAGGAMTASCASTASCSGCTRTLSTARAYGETALTAPSTDGTSMPIDGDRRARPDARAEPAGADQRHPVEHRAELAEVRLGLLLALPLVAPQPGDRDVAVRRRAARRARAAARAARRAPRRRTGRCACRTRACATSSVTLRHPAQRRRERRHAGPDRAHVADHERVGLEARRGPSRG